MAKYTPVNMQRIELSYFDGINTLVGSNISKKQELSHAENARSPVIGIVEKREGTRRLGNEITATANYGIFFFENTGNNGFYRISTVGGFTTIYYVANDGTWTALTDADAIHLLELGDSTTQFDISNPAGTTFRYTWDTTGTDPDIDAHVVVGATIVVAAQNFNANNNGTFTITGVSTNYFDVTNAAGVVEANKTIGTGTITVTGNKFFHTFAEDNCFLVNGVNDNRYITSNGTNVVSSATATGHLYNSPKARKINFYKDRLYLADYILGTTSTASKRYRTSVQRSSYPLGICSLVSGDHAVGVTSVSVTDTKYIYASDSLDVYRGNTLIETLTVSAKTENSITVAATANAINSADELWVAGTFNGQRVFRWVNNAPSGTQVKEYDTFKLSGSQNDAVTMFTNVGNTMIIANKNNLAIWNDYNLSNLDIGIGCVSERGYVKSLGSLWFVHYTGIFATTGGIPKMISAKVDKYIQGATKAGLEAAAMGKKGTNIFCAIGDVTLYNDDGSVNKTLSDVCLEYSIRQENWYVHTGIEASQFETYVASTNPDRLEFSSTTSPMHVYELFNTEEDSDTEFQMRVDTDNITLAKNFENICYPLDVILEVERGSGFQCFVSLDNGPFYELPGEIRKGCRILKVINGNPNDASPPRCRQIKLSIRDFTSKRCRVSRVALVYATTMEQEEERGNKE